MFFSVGISALGAESRGFESPHPDHFYTLIRKSLQLLWIFCYMLQNTAKIRHSQVKLRHFYGKFTALCFFQPLVPIYFTLISGLGCS